MPNCRWSNALLLVLAATGSARGHHSIAAVYDSAQRATVEGAVVEFQFVNPHPILVIDTAREPGESQLWRLEMDNRFELQQIGMSAETFKRGERVVAEGSAHRTERQRLYLRRLDRPADGFLYEQLGSRPRTSVTRP